MTEKEIIAKWVNNDIAKGNLSIMIFDGWKIKAYQTFDPDNNFQNRGSNTYYAYERYGSVVRVEDIQHDIVYHQSWSALMPVVEKIIKLKYPDGEDIFLRTFGMLDEKGNLMVRFNRSQLFHDKSLIKATWFAVVDFIEYFNEEIKAEDISVSRPMI